MTIADPTIILPSFDLTLPEFDLDLPATIDLPLGIRAEETWIRVVRRGDGGVAVEAGAKNFVLTWNGNDLAALGGAFVLGYKTADGQERYWMEATLFERQHPAATATGPDDYTFELPFDVLGLKAECWRFKLGLFMSSANDRACFQALLEIGGLEITSALLEGGETGQFRTDVRLLMRDLTIMVNDMTAESIEFFDGVTEPAAVFGKYKKVRIPALSFAADLLKAPDPQKPANDYGMRFVDGDFRSGERLFLAWRQQGTQFLRALAHDLLGSAPPARRERRKLPR
uniref:hypothetical protein n=1 Tax=Neorhizobium sp. EC2-8 TaxID=3129230 RepID=UPI003100F6CB